MCGVQQHIGTIEECVSTKFSFFGAMWQKPRLNGVREPISPKYKYRLKLIYIEYPKSRPISFLIRRNRDLDEKMFFNNIYSFQILSPSIPDFLLAKNGERS